MKELLLSLLFLFSYSVLAQPLKAEKTLRVSQIVYPPYFTEKFDGILNKKINLMLSPYTVKWFTIPLPRAISHLNSEDIDINTSLLKLESRLALLDFSEKPITTLPPTFCVHNDIKSRLKKDLYSLVKDKKLLLPKGIYLVEYLKKVSSHAKIVEINYKGNYTYRALNMLHKRRVDVAFFPENNSFKKRASEKNVSCRQMLPEKQLHFSFKKGSPFKEIIDKLMTK